jgi:hypothetical protein
MIGRRMRILIVALLCLISACQLYCKASCPNTLTIRLTDPTGTPATPESLAFQDGFTVGGITLLCDGGVSGTHVPASCSGNSITYDSRSAIELEVSLKTTSGKVFQGTLNPTFMNTSPPANACCSGTNATVDVVAR